MEEGYEIEQIIVYTGYSDITKYFASNDIFVKTGWIETRKIDASIRLNNIFFKIDNNQELNAYDICDACLLPVYNHGKSNDELIDILVYITKNCKTEEFLFEILITCVFGWINYLLVDRKKINQIIGDLKMMGEVGFKEMWEHIFSEQYSGIIELKDEELHQKDETISQQANALTQKDEELSLKDEELSLKDEELSLKDEELSLKEEELIEKTKTIEKLLQYAPEDVKKDLENIK